MFSVPKFACIQLLYLKLDAEEQGIKERGFEGTKDSVTVPGLRIPNVSSLKCNVRKRKQTSTAFKATQLSNEKEQDLWGHDLSLAAHGWVPTVMPREGTVHLHEVIYLWCFIIDLIGSIDFRASFLIMMLFFCYIPIPPKRVIPVWLFLR